jgi:predicted DNA-binding protein (MmcQ/YjbR family)
VPPSRLQRIRTISLALPEAVEKPFGGHLTAPAFRVRDKFFVMCDETARSINLKAPRGAASVLIGSDPDRFFMPKYVGPKGWVGVRLDLAAPPDWDEIAEMVCESYCLVAPKRLVTQWELNRPG